jgi:hypothetical protein
MFDRRKTGENYRVSLARLHTGSTIVFALVYSEERSDRCKSHLRLFVLLPLRVREHGAMFTLMRMKQRLVWPLRLERLELQNAL